MDATLKAVFKTLPMDDVHFAAVRSMTMAVIVLSRSIGSMPSMLWLQIEFGRLMSLMERSAIFHQGSH